MFFGPKCSLSTDILPIEGDLSTISCGYPPRLCTISALFPAFSCIPATSFAGKREKSLRAAGKGSPARFLPGHLVKIAPPCQTQVGVYPVSPSVKHRPRSQSHEIDVAASVMQPASCRFGMRGLGKRFCRNGTAFCPFGRMCAGRLDARAECAYDGLTVKRWFNCLSMNTTNREEHLP